MSRKEIATRSASKKPSTKDKKKEEKNHRRKSNEDTDSDEDEFDSDYDDDDEEDEEDEDEMDVHEYRKFLSKIFPSKNLNEKIKSGEKLKKALKEEVEKHSKSHRKSWNGISIGARLPWRDNRIQLFSLCARKPLKTSSKSTE